MNERLKILVDSRRIEPHPAADDEIAALWEKAVRALRSSRGHDVDADSAFAVAYNELHARLAMPTTCGKTGTVRSMGP